MFLIIFRTQSLEGTKLTGNKHVPAGKKTFMIDVTTSPYHVMMQHASVGFKNARWVSEYRLERASRDQFVIKHERRTAWDCQFYHWSLLTLELV